MLTKGKTRRLELPHEPGEWIEVRLLGLDDVVEVRREARLSEGESLLQLVGDDAIMAVIKPTLCRCIQAWSYEEPVSPEAIGTLDAKTAVYILTELLPAQESEEDRKNGISPSTAASTVKARR